MCRICGIVDPKNNNLKNDIETMSNSMKRGGPDSFGYLINNKVGLGHRRLKIIDLSNRADQPMSLESKELFLIFNGEIYNYKILKRQLLSKGVIFKTTSDTEVILRGFELEGENFLYKLKGMFSIVLYNKIFSKLILYRDPSGIKPLYYYAHNNKFYFSSEIRALKSLNRFNENPDWKIFFLAFGFIPEPYTTLENVFSLEAGSIFKYDIDKGVLNKNNPIQTPVKQIINNKNAATRLIYDKLHVAVKNHLVSDVPVSFFLSGGIDSSILSIIGAKFSKNPINTISIDFEEVEYSERKYQEQIVNMLKTDHINKSVKKEDFSNSLDDVLLAMDQPSIDAINTYFICKYAKASGAKVVFSGIGADEIFCGYSTFKRIKRMLFLRRLPKRLFKLLKVIKSRKANRLSFFQLDGIIGLYLVNRGLHDPNEISELLKIPVNIVIDKLNTLNTYYNIALNKHHIDVASYLDFSIYMKNQLLRDSDYMSMWHSIELRVPFLDEDLLSAVKSINPKLRYDSKIQKKLLIDSFKNELPETIWNRKKMGFEFPFKKWITYEDLKFSNINSHCENQYSKGNYNWSQYWATKISNI